MKHFFTLRRIFAALVLICRTGSAQAQADTPILIYPTQLIVQHTYMQIEAYSYGGRLFREIFQVSNGTGSQYQFDSNGTYEVTDYAGIEKFEQECTPPEGTTVDEGKYFKTIRVKYGLALDTGTQKYKLKFVYVPVIMKWKTKIPAGNPTTDVFIALPGNDDAKEWERCYVLDNKRFRKLSQNEVAGAKTWIDNYKKHIRIDAKYSGTFRGHNLIPDSPSGDAVSETLTFKELEHFFKNKPGDIYINSYTNTALPHGVATFKHFVAFSNSPYHNAVEGVHEAVDLGTMCPPNCLEIKVFKGYTSSKSNSAVAYVDELRNNDREKSSQEGPKKESSNTTIWLVVAAGCLLIGFVVARLLKK